jgi:hypothetical protein
MRKAAAPNLKRASVPVVPECKTFASAVFGNTRKVVTVSRALFA